MPLNGATVLTMSLALGGTAAVVLYGAIVPAAVVSNPVVPTTTVTTRPAPVSVPAPCGPDSVQVGEECVVSVEQISYSAVGDTTGGTGGAAGAGQDGGGQGGAGQGGGAGQVEGYQPEQASYADDDGDRSEDGEHADDRSEDRPEHAEEQADSPDHAAGHSDETADEDSGDGESHESGD